MPAVTREDMAHVWAASKRADADYFAHVQAHRGPLAHTLACTRLADGCHGDGESLLQRSRNLWDHYESLAMEYGK